MVDTGRMSMRGSRCDLCGRRRLPQVDQGKIYAAFGLADSLQVPAEVLRVIVDQLCQLLHQLAYGPMSPEIGDHDEEAGIAAGENLEGTDATTAQPRRR